MAGVVVTRNEQIERAIAEALGRLDLEPLVRDRLVAVKPNDAWASPEDKTGVTQPDTLRPQPPAVIRERVSAVGGCLVTGGVIVPRKEYP